MKKIAYGDQDIAEINDIVRLLGDAFSEDARLYNEDNDTGSISINFGHKGKKHAIYKNAAKSLFTAKHGAFRQEKEWRLFTFGDLSSIAGVKRRGTGKAISPYIPIAIPEEAVTQVTLGPMGGGIGMNWNGEHDLNWNA